MTGERKKSRRPGLPRKLVLAGGGGILLLLTASAAGAWFMGAAGLLAGRSAATYGVDCRLLGSVSFDHGGERWVRQFIAVGRADPAGRLRTALRVAEDAAGSERADLVVVVAMDEKGPVSRPLMRDHAVGARVLYAPHPARVTGVTAPLAASYVDADPTGAGEFYGKLDRPPLAALEKMASAMKKPFGCTTPEPVAKAREKSGHAAPAGRSTDR